MHDVSSLTIAERVQHGVNLLDMLKPEWREGVNPETLRISSCHQCVLGQLYGSFDGGNNALWDHLDLSDDERQAIAAYHGFTSNPEFILRYLRCSALGRDREDILHEERHEFAALTEEWRRVLTKGGAA